MWPRSTRSAGMWRGRLRAGAIAWLLLTLATPVQADFDDPYVAAKLSLGVGGRADYYDGDIDISSSASVTASNEPLEPSYGGAVAFSYPLWSLLALGGQLALGRRACPRPRLMVEERGRRGLGPVLA
jgi:hypothetical protein